MVDLAQGAQWIVYDVLREAGRPMTVAEIAVEFDRLGVVHARPTTKQCVWSALGKRKKNHRDVVRVARSTWALATDASMRRDSVQLLTDEELATREECVAPGETSEVPTRYRRGDRIVRGGKLLEFIEEELEGAKWRVVGPAPR